jgi:protein-tyrosine phosphatase
VTALSLTGRFGAPAEKATQALLDRNWVHFISSDAHNLIGRPPRLRWAYDKLTEMRGAEVAQALFHDNPLAAWNGEPLVWVPEPEPVSSTSSRWRRFFSS